MWICVPVYLERDCEGSIPVIEYHSASKYFLFFIFYFLVHRRDARGDLFRNSLLHIETNEEEF